MAWKRAPVLVTGATGVIGHALVSELQRSGYQQVVKLSSADVNLIDSRKTADFFSGLKPQLVFHLAARVFGIMGNLKNQGAAFYDNIQINTNVLEACRRVGVSKIVAMGSTAIYSDQVVLPMSEDQIWKGPPHQSEEAYAHAKRAMLAQLEAYRKSYGMDYAFCISTNLYGPHDKFDEENGHVVPSLISKFHRGAKSGEPLTVWGTGTPERDFLYSKDAAVALRMVGEKYSGPINIASGQPVSIRNLVRILQEISGATKIVWDHNKPDGQKIRDYDISKLRNLGFRPRFSLEEGLLETYQWYSRNFETVRR